jgi:dTDP-glucose 4,6-dehydratase
MKDSMKVLVTGGAGFIGNHFIRLLLRECPNASVVCFDALTYAAHPDTVLELSGLAPDRYRFVKGDISDPKVEDLIRDEGVDAIVNFAAESHVDRSILDSTAFVKTNTLGAENLAACARRVGSLRFVHVSTDEVYGSLSPDVAPCSEEAHLHPNSPYAASKAAADLLLLAAYRTYGQPILITRCTNNYGPYQFPEKLLPLLISNALEGQKIPVYGDGKQVRDWIYVEDHCHAILDVLLKGQVGEVYNVTSREEHPNLEVVQSVLAMMGKPLDLIQHVGDRPAHDRRYALNPTKIEKELGWKPRVSFKEGLTLTVDWYMNHRPWWTKVRNKDYYQFYRSNYDSKTATEGVQPL